MNIKTNTTYISGILKNSWRLKWRQKHQPAKKKKKKKKNKLRKPERSEKAKKKKKNQKNFNSFIHSINIILDMVFLYTLYIFKGMYTLPMDCGVKKVCEGFKHRMVFASSTVPPSECVFSEWIECTRPTNGNRKKAITRRRRKEKRRSSLEWWWGHEKREFVEGGEKLMHRLYGFLLKANRKKLYIQTYRCVYISFSAWALNDVIAGIRRVNPETLPIFSHSISFFSSVENNKNLSINKKQNMCTVHCKRSFLYLILLRSAEKENTKQRTEGIRGQGQKLPLLLLRLFFFWGFFEWEIFAL